MFAKNSLHLLKFYFDYKFMNDNTPLVSIVIATFNAGSTLDDCINSISLQSYKNYEIIVVDGLSKDNTVDIIKRYEQVIVKWVSEPDRGIYDAWNKGVALSSGEWISFIGSDDTFYPSALEDYVQHINSLNNPKLEFVSSIMHLVNKDGHIIKAFGFPWEWKKSRLRNTIAHPGSFHSKSIFENYGTFDVHFKICGDYELLLRPGDKFVSSYLNKITVRMAQGGISSNDTAMFKEHYHAVTTTGKLSKPIAGYYFIVQMSRGYIKTFLRNIGVNI
jgi:glycosyltransferase involved in cell wall biosynthesis